MLRRLAIVAIAAAVPLAAAAQNWSEARTEHFSVVSPLGDNKTVAAAQNLEQMRALMGRLLARSDLHVSAPTYIMVFPTESAMSKVLDTPAGQNEISYAGPDASFFAYDTSSDAALTRLLLDFGRFLLDTNYPHTPPWFDDGLAEYFSTARIRDQIRVTTGTPPPALAKNLQSSEWIPIEQVLAAGSDSPLRQKDQFRAEAWAVVSYIFTNQKVGDTGRYFGLTQNQDVAVPDAIQQAYGMSPAQLDQAVRSAAAAPSQPRQGDAPAAPAEGTVKVYVESPADLEALAADYRLHAAPSDNDIDQLRSALEKGNNIAVLRTLGFAYLQKKDLNNAADYLKRTAALDPKDLRTNYYLGRLGYEQGGGEAARMPLQSAVSASPEFADAQYLLGMTLLDSSDMAGSIRALQTAVKLAPRRDSYSLALAGAYLQARDFDRGQAVLDRLARSSDPQVAAAAAKKRATIAELKSAPATSSVDVNVYHYDEKQWGEPSGKIPSVDELDKDIKEREEAQKAQQPDTRPVRFAKGMLMKVDCSKSPAAILTVVIDTKPVTFYSADRAGLAVIGAESLSCDLKNREVSLNYRPGSAHADNDLISVELK